MTNSLARLMSILYASLAETHFDADKQMRFFVSCRVSRLKFPDDLQKYDAYLSTSLCQIAPYKYDYILS